MDEKNLKERDFHCYVGWKVPLFIKIAWLGLAIWIMTYFVKFLLPSLRSWIGT